MGPRTFATVRELIWYNCSSVRGIPSQLLYSVANGDLLQEDLCYKLCTPELLLQKPLSPCLAGDLQTLTGRSDLISCVWGGHCSFPWVLVHTRFFFCALQASLAGMRIDSQWDYTPPVALLLYLLCPWIWGAVSFFGGFQHPLDDCSALVMILVLSQEKISACPSTPPSCC